MARLLVFVEGHTEAAFVDEVLQPHLVASGYHQVSARLLGSAMQNTHRGGIRSWSQVRRDLSRKLLEDRTGLVTTMVDYYRLPADWPGRGTSATPSEIQFRLHADMAAQLNSAFDAGRFLPFVVMHEFEGLLFSDCTAFSRTIGRADLETEFRKIRDAFPTPEDINDSPSTAPSKRILNLSPRYKKLDGVAAANAIGLDRIRKECPHFASWLDRLEALVSKE